MKICIEFLKIWELFVQPGVSSGELRGETPAAQDPDDTVLSKPTTANTSFHYPKTEAKTSQYYVLCYIFREDVKKN